MASFHDALSASGLVPPNYVRPGADDARAFESRVRHLLAHRKLPREGWSERDIVALLDRLAGMDSNNLGVRCGVGEREGRVYSDLVSRRHFGLSHGIGRSGDLCEPQPKAAGSSAAAALANALVLDAVRSSGARSTADCFVAPMATGMTLTLCLLALRKVRPAGKFVVWSRIDQKSCFKSIAAAGLIPVVVELERRGDELRTDVAALSAALDGLDGGPDAAVAVFTTTSCFAPRAPDDLPAVAKLCRERDVPHLVNNAYGLQSSKCMHLLEEAGKIAGPYDVFVQSTDKNLMVPVGGAIVAGFSKDWVRKISQTYPGRASASQSIDVLITLLSMGADGFQRLLKERKENFKLLSDKLGAVAKKHGERVMQTKNPISLAMTLDSFSSSGDSTDSKSASEVGSRLFTRGVSGTRVMTGKQDKTVEGHTFKCWGSHSDDATTPYLTAAAAVGMDAAEVGLFARKLDKVLEEVARRRGNKGGKDGDTVESSEEVARRRNTSGKDGVKSLEEDGKVDKSKKDGNAVKNLEDKKDDGKGDKNTKDGDTVKSLEGKKEIGASERVKSAGGRNKNEKDGDAVKSVENRKKVGAGAGGRNKNEKDGGNVKSERDVETGKSAEGPNKSKKDGDTVENRDEKAED